MNAYDLAKELEACFTKADWNVLEAANMLRQQADMVAELEKAITNYRTASDIQEEVIKKLEKDNKELHAIAQRMAMAESDARKSLQSTKDAQAKLIDDAVEIGIAEGFAKALTQYPPKTTPQTKLLSDEEIIDFIKSWEGLVVTNRTVAMIRAIEAKVRG